MKIYTKKGDSGKTSLIGGTRVSKSDLRIDAYGTVDELNSYIGWTRDLSVSEAVRKLLLEIQDRLFTIGSRLAEDREKSNMKLPLLNEDDIKILEDAMDNMNNTLPEMKSFILPGGHPAVSCCHVARCVCRRAERLIVSVSENSEVDPLILKYMNRLSDYLFVLSRTLSFELKAEENPWIAKL
jgi:cob(I)alamin adenosyltransferase